MNPLHRRTEWGWLGHLARGSARHRVAVLFLTFLAMGGLALGLPRLTFEDNPIDAMPTGHPNTLAAENLTYTFPGTAYASPVFVSVDPAKWAVANLQLPNRVPLGAASPIQVPAGQPSPNDAAALLNQLLTQASGGQAPGSAEPIPGPLNITDEVYMRGMHELFRFLQAQERVPELKWAITLESQVRLVNYTNTGIPGAGTGPTARPLKEPDAAAFSMPGTDPVGAMQFSSDWNSYYLSSPASVRSIVSKDWQSTRLAFLFDPGEKSLPQIGQDLQVAVDEYRTEVAQCDATPDRCNLEWNVFAYDSIIVDPRAPTAASAHLTDTTLEDLLRLGPIAILFVGAMLFAAFRRPGTVVAMTLPLSIAGFGVLGAFGWLGLPIHSVSLLVFPVLIGTGIDFGIHMAASYHEARGRGRVPLDAAFDAGQGAGVPLVIVTITTLVGMAFLILAPNRLLAQLGLAILIGLSLLLVVALTALPAALSWCTTPPPRKTLTDRFLVRNAAFWGRHRAVGLGLVLVLMAVSVAAAPMLKTLVIGTPAAYFPGDDRQHRDFDASNDRYFDQQQDLVTNVLVMEGDLTTPAAQEMLGDLEERLKTLDFVRDDSVVSIHFALNAWIQVRQGTAGAPAILAQEAAQPGSTFPTDQASIKALMDEMFETPLQNYAAFFVNHPTYDIGVMLVEIAQPAEFEALEEQWDAINKVIAQVQRENPHAGLRVHMAGGSAIAYLFTATELPYVQTAALIGLVVTALQVLVLRRSLRDALVVSAVVVAAGAWWMGLLVVMDIPLSIALVVPVVILEAIASDYALHLRYAIGHEGARAWGTVGRAIWYSAITDIGAFLVFTRMRYGLLADATVATVLVLTCALVATLILVPALAHRRELPRSPGEAPPSPSNLVTA
ncbi:MAG: MMPL family transporter [Candidatus Thermoplasmatota archaeon]|jgi:predicted RND superfamily exporter protein